VELYLLFPTRLHGVALKKMYRDYFTLPFWSWNWKLTLSIVFHSKYAETVMMGRYPHDSGGESRCETGRLQVLHAMRRSMNYFWVCVK
jgi:hypothetical protein